MLFYISALLALSVSHNNQIDYTIIGNKQLISQKDLDKITKNVIPMELDHLYANVLFCEESAV